jgi:pyruvate/2-oxoglutarate dehydrogenase complex dihydrolipoamide dehydrogenase (E3) component
VPAVPRWRRDAIVMGRGAGPSLAVRLAKAGQRTAIIERKRFGGTCVNNGCIPTKTLIGARAAHVTRRAEAWGVIVPAGCAPTCRPSKPARMLS